MKNQVPYQKITVRARSDNVDTAGLHEKLAVSAGLNLLCEQVMKWYDQASGLTQEVVIGGIDTIFIRGGLTQRQGEFKYIVNESISDCFLHLNCAPTRGEYTATRTGILLNSIWAHRTDMNDVRTLLYQSDVEEMCLHLR